MKSDGILAVWIIFGLFTVIVAAPFLIVIVQSNYYKLKARYYQFMARREIKKIRKRNLPEKIKNRVDVLEKELDNIQNHF